MSTQDPDSTTEVQDLEEMIRLAHRARHNAYAPYSGFPVGACLRSSDGSLHAGCNVENASFPLGHCAETSALGVLVSSGAPPDITHIVVVTENASSPCGGCRQKLAEHARRDAPVFLCDLQGVQKRLEFQQLLPEAFDGSTLRREGS